ncbi:MAG: AAA-like domain-containing protein [Muribaculaceae bacterium]|nr:AAA-like domain-containing protein [Muribaculaceae bacterium]
MERYFNTAGSNVPSMQYTLDPLSRLDLDEILTLIRQGKYFGLHAPRLSGKTSYLLALRDYLNERGDYIAVYVNVEGGQAARNDVLTVISGACETIGHRTAAVIKDQTPIQLLEQIKSVSSSAMLTSYLSYLSEALPKPLVLFIDEIDALVGDSLVSVLRQIRAGYDERPTRFPQSIVLCGVRDVRDHRIVLSNQDIITGGSSFNIKAKSLRLGNFTPDEIRALYGQHTAETGQVFEEECFPLVWQATEGQPWLVNALAHEVTYKMRENRDRTVRITPEMMYRAQERIIYRRDTHIDQLIDKLREPRVKRVIEPIIANSDNVQQQDIPDDDIMYCTDLGLVKKETGRPLRIACGIYREIIPRELTWSKQQTMITQEPVWYLNTDGSLNIEKLLLDFQQFFRQNADSWIGQFDYAEAGPQLLLQAFLQRVVNGGGYIDREYGLGRRRTDLLIRKPLTDGYGGPIQRVVLELKILRGDLEKTIEKGLEQTSAYMDLVGAVDEGHFIVFDRSGNKTWDERIWHEPRQHQGRTITVWGM